MATFAERMQLAIAPGVYDNAMRRSVQTVCLYESNRCLAERLPSLRPFQRKIALLDMANHLCQSLSATSHQKEEIMYRTATSKEPLNADVAWKRMKLIDREIQIIITKLKPYLEGKSPEEACELFVQTQYESVTNNKKPYPRSWIYTHNNVFLTYKMYYVGEDLKTDLPDAKPPKQIVVPAEKPIKGLASTNPYLLSIGNEKGNVVSNTPGKETDLNDDELEAIVNQDSSKRKEPDDRRLVLKEVRDHLDLLKEFEGVIPEDELNKRKRELFAALPAAPPPAKKLQTATPAKGENEALATI